MAVDLHNPESLLPSSLFQSENESEDAINPTTGQGESKNWCFASTASSATTDIWGEQELSCGSVSSGSRSSESETCSEETGDDDYMAELSLQMAQYMFHEDDKLAVPGLPTDTQQKTWGLATSPQSTLWSPMGSTQWSQNGSSREPSPPVTESRGWDNTMPHHEKQRLQPEKNSNQAQTDYQLRAIQFYKLKQEQVARKQLQGNNKKLSQQNKERAKPRPVANPWSNSNAGLESNHAGSGMRAVFLGPSGSRSGSCGGTGVFLPRVDRSKPSESRKKLGCSSVLIPARVAEALKLHFDHVGLVSRPSSITNYDSGKIQSRKGQSAAYEVGLPQEWTY